MVRMRGQILRALWFSLCGFGLYFCTMFLTHPRMSFPGIADVGYPFTWKSIYRPCWGEEGPAPQYRLWVLARLAPIFSARSQK